MDKIIDDFQKQLAAAVPELEYIDEDMGQLDYPADFPAMKFPCALIDVQSGEFTNDGELRQRGVLTVAVKLCALQAGTAATPESQKNAARKGWKICQSIQLALHGKNFLGRGLGAPVRASMARIKRDDGIYERDIVYAIGVTDLSCVPEWEMTTAAPKIRASVAGK